MATSLSAISLNTEITFMDSRLYWGAAEGQIDIFTADRALQLDRILTTGKNSVLHIHITASVTGDIGFVKEILGICPQLLMQPNEYGDIPLHVAARYGHINIVEHLIERAKALDLESGTHSIATGGVLAKEMLRKKNKENDTSLHEAVRFGYDGVVRILTTEDPDYYLYGANKSGETPLYIAVERGYGYVISEILNNCSSPLVAAGGPNGRTALHDAVIAQYKGIPPLILEKMEHLTKESDDKGWVPLHYAADGNSLWIVQLLLDYDKKAAYLKDKEGRTPLHIAASRGNYEILKRIIQLCPDCCEVVDNKGWNVLHYLVQGTRNRKDSMKFILNTPALSYLLNAKDNAGNTPLHMTTDIMSNALRLLTHPRLDKKAYNKQNQNTLDIAVSTGVGLRTRILQWRLSNVGLTSSRRIMLNRSEDGERLDEDEKKRIDVNDSRKEKFSEGSLVVAVLIATVTFAVLFTLPGGYVTDKGPLQGTAILRKDIPFIVFVTTDAIAFLLSSAAVLSHYLLLSTNKNKRKVIFHSQRSKKLTVYALEAMVFTFNFAMIIVLKPSSFFFMVIWCSIMPLFVISSIHHFGPL